MQNLFINQNWLTWILILTIAFPILFVVLGEIALWLERRNRPLFTPIRILRNLVLPILAGFCLLWQVLGISRDEILVRLIETILWIAIIYAGLSVINALLFAEAKEGSWQANVPKLFIDLSRVFLILMGVAIVLSSIWKADLGGVLTALGVGSLVLGLALQDSLGNIFSGIALLFERPFALGDWLQMGDITGKVIEITWRSVHLRTTSGNLLVVPNSQLAKDSFSNLSRPTLMYETSFEVGFSYDDPPNKVKQILLQAALETEGVLKEPPPYLRVTAYGDFYINYKVFLLTKDYISSLRIRSDYITRVWYAAKRHNLTIPFPTANYYEYQVPLPSPPVKDYALQLRLFPGMNSVDPSFLEQLAQESTTIEFAQGEIVIAQGNPILGLYFILEGKAEMIFNTSTGNSQVIEQLNAGEYFGEKICLFSGQISDVTVKAIEDLSVLILNKNSLNLLIANNPYFMQAIAEIMEMRQSLMNNYRKSSLLK